MEFNLVHAHFTRAVDLLKCNIVDSDYFVCPETHLEITSGGISMGYIIYIRICFFFSFQNILLDLE